MYIYIYVHICIYIYTIHLIQPIQPYIYTYNIYLYRVEGPHFTKPQDWWPPKTVREQPRLYTYSSYINHIRYKSQMDISVINHFKHLKL